MFKPSFPLHIVLILSNRCNLSCLHCSSNADKSGSIGYSTPEAKRILDQLADAGVIDVAFSGGEPLLRHDLPELVAYARSHGMTVGTSTNGYPLTDKTAERLKSAGLNRLQVSIDGTQQTHDIIRGQGSYVKAVAAVQRSVAVGLRTHISFTAMRLNVHHLEEVVRLCIALGADGFNLSQFVPTGRGPEEQDLGPTLAREVLLAWLDARRRYPDLYMSTHFAGLADLDLRNETCVGGCQAGLGLGCITAEGDVTPCVMLPLSLGNVRNQTFREIWSRSPTVAELQDRQLGGACGACEHRARCGGCRAAAWARTGDILAQDPRCWRAR
jgi:radical SAM protein with 4Fe4S-binding SPASM domain